MHFNRNLLNHREQQQININENLKIKQKQKRIQYKMGFHSISTATLSCVNKIDMVKHYLNMKD